MKTKCHMFLFRLSHSGKAIHRVYPTCGQEALPAGHIEAFETLGGVPTRHIRYDNLSSAVTTVPHGKDRRREQNQRWVLFCSHYGFDAFYCQPGIAGAHDKGGSRARSAGSAATTSPRCPPSTPWTSSTTSSATGKPQMMPPAGGKDFHGRRRLPSRA